LSAPVIDGWACKSRPDEKLHPHRVETLHQTGLVHRDGR